MKYITILFRACCILFGLTLSGCQLIDNDKPVKAPIPEIVKAQELPDHIYASDNVYYLVHKNSNSKKWEEGAEIILNELVENDLHPEKAWFPIGVTPCMAPNAFEAFIVELNHSDSLILEFDFTSDSDSLVLNCGIDEFEYYKF